MALAPLPRSVDALFALPQSDVNAAVLAANTAETITIPSGATHVSFSANTDFYMKFNGTAAVPGADVSDGSASELNPTVRRLLLGDGTAVTSISVISPVAAVVTAMFFKAPSP